MSDVVPCKGVTGRASGASSCRTSTRKHGGQGLAVDLDTARFSDTISSRGIERVTT